MTIENLTIKEAQEKLEEYKQLQKLFNVSIDAASVASNNPYEIGKNYLIRTVTMTLTGRLKSIGDKELVLEDVCWIANTGRFHDALKDGIEQLDFSEIEPFVNDVIIGRGAIVDCTVYDNGLPNKQK